jgi:hypothetical protein
MHSSFANFMVTLLSTVEFRLHKCRQFSGKKTVSIKTSGAKDAGGSVRGRETSTGQGFGRFLHASFDSFAVTYGTISRGYSCEKALLDYMSVYTFVL